MDKQPQITKLLSLSLMGLFLLGIVVWFSPIFNGKREYYEAKATGETADIQIGTLKIKAEVVKSERDMAEGLSHRNSLAKGYGMLFNLGSAQTISFWMKDMQFNLDMIWIANSQVVGIDRNIPYPKKNEYPLIKKSPGEVQYVLEVMPGQTQGIAIGDIFRLK